MRHSYGVVSKLSVAFWMETAFAVTPLRKLLVKWKVPLPLAWGGVVVVLPPFPVLPAERSGKPNVRDAEMLLIVARRSTPFGAPDYYRLAPPEVLV